MHQLQVNRGAPTGGLEVHPSPRTSKSALEDLLEITCGRPKFSTLQPVDLPEYSTRNITENQPFSLSDWKISYPLRQPLMTN